MVEIPEDVINFSVKRSSSSIEFEAGLSNTEDISLFPKSDTYRGNQHFVKYFKIIYIYFLFIQQTLFKLAFFISQETLVYFYVFAKSEYVVKFFKKRFLLKKILIFLFLPELY